MNQKGKFENCIRKACLQFNGMFADLTALFRKIKLPGISLWRNALILFALLVGLTGGIYVYAKYYSISAKEGIAIATGVYFKANYAAAPITEKDEDGNEVQVDAFVESIVDYSGGNTSFTFEVYNYENNLLFNTSNVDIPYTVEFWLAKEPTDAAKYYVNAGDSKTDDRVQFSTTETRSFSDTVEGGAAVAKKYTISIDADTGHAAVPIYVRVQTLTGALINRTLTGKILLTSVGKAESYIESNQFVVPEGTVEGTEFATLQEMSGFTYEIRTAGTVTTGELTEKIKVSWDPTVLQIDLFDEAYVEWLNGVQISDNSVKGPFTETVTVDGVSKEWYYIEIEAMPYASETIGFFRGADFETTFSSMDDKENWENLHTNCIKVEKVDTTS